MDFTKLSDAERLAAEQAVLTMRALNKAADEAPWCHGMDYLEAVIHKEGFDHLRAMMQAVASARPEAQKKGSLPGGIAAVATKPNSKP